MDHAFLLNDSHLSLLVAEEQAGAVHLPAQLKAAPSGESGAQSGSRDLPRSESRSQWGGFSEVLNLPTPRCFHF